METLKYKLRIKLQMSSCIKSRGKANSKTLHLCPPLITMLCYTILVILSIQCQSFQSKNLRDPNPKTPKTNIALIESSIHAHDTALSTLRSTANEILSTSTSTSTSTEVGDPFTATMVASGVIYLGSAMVNAGVKRWYASKYNEEKKESASTIKKKLEQTCEIFADLYTRLRFQHFTLEKVAVFLILKLLPIGHTFTSSTPLTLETKLLLPKSIQLNFKSFFLSMMALENSQQSLYQVFGDGSSLCPQFVPHPRSHFIPDVFPNALSALTSHLEDPESQTKTDQVQNIIYQTEVMLFSETDGTTISETEKDIMSRLLGTIDEHTHAELPSSLVWVNVNLQSHSIVVDAKSDGRNDFVWKQRWMSTNIKKIKPYDMSIDMFTSTGSILGRDDP